MSRETWELYYVYNKIIVSFIRRARNIYVLHANSKEYLSEVNNNIGMILRLMFVKSLHTCNSLFREFRATKGVLPPVLENFLVSPCKLKTIWNYMNVENPTGFWSYVKTKKYERIWRKFEINESKDRSKFFPSERLIITNRILSECLNISRCI